jgi:hypothetical protein
MQHRFYRFLMQLLLHLQLVNVSLAFYHGGSGSFRHPKGNQPNMDQIAEQLASGEGGALPASALSKSLRPFVARTGKAIASFFGGGASDLQQRVKSAQEVVATAEKESMLLGILMAHKGWSESQQLKLLKSSEFQHLDVVQQVLKHRNSKESVVDQISKYLDQQGSDDQAAARLLSSTNEHDSKALLPEVGLLQRQSQWDSCHLCAAHAHCLAKCHISHGRLFAQCITDDCSHLI